ncbi:MAG: hypothetical protein HC789_23765, partial [Microcoleus sp. CSU_2_2]|nr:hypothetical protein [Microcoleus sp. CSU_2_2]
RPQWPRSPAVASIARSGLDRLFSPRSPAGTCASVPLIARELWRNGLVCNAMFGMYIHRWRRSVFDLFYGIFVTAIYVSFLVPHLPEKGYIAIATRS